MIKNMDKEFTLGQIVECMKVDSIMVNNMERVHTDKPVVRKFTVYGRKEKRPKYAKHMKIHDILI